jgi:riboflavin synthase
VFSGIVERVGEVSGLRPLRGDAELTVASGFRGLALGESIAVNGACMTVARRRGSSFTAIVSAESLRRTTLGALRAGDSVNLERSLRVSDRLSGHFVFGHVDGVGTLQAVRPEGGSALYRFSLPAGFGRFLVEKGSIAVDGVSLTVFDCGRRSFTVSVIPHTAGATTLGRMRTGARVNLETDMLARYVDRAVAHHLRRR